MMQMKHQATASALRDTSLKPSGTQRRIAIGEFEFHMIKITR
jgi:hypothetical protein